MLRRTVFRKDRLVIVESPNKTAKITGILQSNVPDWTFGTARLAKAANPLKGAKEGVAVMATIGHFMDTKDLMIDRSDLEIPSSPMAQEAAPAAAETATKAKGKKGGKKKLGSSALLDLPPMPDGAPLLSFKPDIRLRPDNTSMEGIVRYITTNKNLTEVVLASDPDREGELIAVHALRYLMKKANVGKKGTGSQPPILFSRAYIQSITEEGIIKAMKDRQLNYCDFALAESASARHSMDRLFGWIGSSLMRKIDKNFISVGRVQTPALILIRDQEKRIQDAKDAHKASFLIQGKLNIFGSSSDVGNSSDDVPIYTRQVNFQIQQGGSDTKDDSSSQFSTKDEAEKWLADAFGNKSAAFKMTVAKAPTISPGKQKPPQPHTMQTLLTTANTQLKLSSDDVTKCLQELFQAGLITYPRTDSVRIEDAFVIDSLKPFIEKRYGAGSFVNNQQLDTKDGKDEKKKEEKDKPKKKKEKEGNVEDAHEALRPTSLERNPADPAVLALFGIGSATPAAVPAGQYNRPSAGSLANHRSAFPVYKLIYQATIAAFMAPAETENATVSVGVRPEGATDGPMLVAKLNATRLTKAGWRSAKMGVDAAAVEEAMKNARGGASAAEDEEDADVTAADATASSTSAFDLIVNLPKYLESSSGQQQQFQAKVAELKVAEKALVLPKPFSEGTLIQELKNFGVGRPSTYPTIIKTLFDRKYVTRDGAQRLSTTPVGQGVVRAARNAFPTLVDIGFTASFERELNAISQFRVEVDDESEKKATKKSTGALELTEPTNPDMGEGLNPLTCYTLSRLTYSLTGMVDEAITSNVLLQEYRMSNVKSLATKATAMASELKANGTEAELGVEAMRAQIAAATGEFAKTSLFDRDPGLDQRRTTLAWRLPKIDIPLLLDTIARGQFKMYNNNGTTYSSNSANVNRSALSRGVANEALATSAAARISSAQGAGLPATAPSSTTAAGSVPEVVTQLTLNILSSTYLNRHIKIAVGDSLHHLGMDEAMQASGDRERLFDVPKKQAGSVATATQPAKQSPPVVAKPSEPATKQAQPDKAPKATKASKAKKAEKPLASPTTSAKSTTETTVSRGEAIKPVKVETATAAGDSGRLGDSLTMSPVTKTTAHVASLKGASPATVVPTPTEVPKAAFTVRPLFSFDAMGTSPAAPLVPPVAVTVETSTAKPTTSSDKPQDEATPAVPSKKPFDPTAFFASGFRSRR